jgi:hypothetical protein
MRQTKKDGPHMNSGGIALRPVQDVGQFAISIPAQRNTPIAQARKEKGSCAQRQVLAIVTGDETTRQTLRKEREGWGTRQGVRKYHPRQQRGLGRLAQSVEKELSLGGRQ